MKHTPFARPLVISLLSLLPVTTKPTQTAQTSVFAEVAVAEVVDKITILEIKVAKFSNAEKRAHCLQELEILQKTYNTSVTHTPELEQLKSELRAINETLWSLEDATRAKEAAQTFDAEFAQLTRSIYINNDQRGLVKRAINDAAGSYIYEEKSHTDYLSDSKYTWKNTSQKHNRGTVSIRTEVAVGELIDKITILEVKFEKITDPAKRANICRELATLYTTLSREIPLTDRLSTLMNDLRAINKKMWDNEDARRSKEKLQKFDEEFIQLGRNVYHINDTRVALKRDINLLIGSHIIEEKEYTDYNQTTP